MRERENERTRERESERTRERENERTRERENERTRERESERARERENERTRERENERTRERENERTRERENERTRWRQTEIQDTYTDAYIYTYTIVRLHSVVCSTGSPLSTLPKSFPEPVSPKPCPEDRIQALGLASSADVRSNCYSSPARFRFGFRIRIEGTV